MTEVHGKTKAIDSFSVFFHTASKKKKNTLFIKAAKKANKDQRDLVKHAKLKFI